jgi:multiple sugar transport system ATP-binding protein
MDKLYIPPSNSIMRLAPKGGGAIAGAAFGGIIGYLFPIVFNQIVSIYLIGIIVSLVANEAEYRWLIRAQRPTNEYLQTFSPRRTEQAQATQQVKREQDTGSIALRNITKSYGSITAVDDVNVEIEAGEFFTFLGPAESGKTTILDIIVGISHPEEGDVYVHSYDSTTPPSKRKGISIVSEEVGLIPHLTVSENISYGLNSSEQETHQRVREVAKLLSLDELLDRMPHELSAVQYKRTEIARAIIREPDIILLDDPFADFDERLRRKLCVEIKRLWNRLGITFVHATRDSEEAMSVSTRLAIISNGTIEQVDEPMVCYKEPNNVFVSKYIQTVPINLIQGTLSSDELIHLNDLVELEIDSTVVDIVPEKEVRIGVRPEDIYLVDQVNQIENPSESFTGIVTRMEPRGNEFLISVSQAEEDSLHNYNSYISDDLLVDISPRFDFTEKRRVSIVFDLSKIHLFDIPSGQAIQHGLVEPVEQGDPNEKGKQSDR